MNKPMISFIEEQAKAPYSRSLWFYNDIMDVYLRAGIQHDYAGSGAMLALTISNITVHQPRQGHLTTLMANLMQRGMNVGYKQLQIENACTPEMIAFCQKHELLMKPRDPEPWAFKNVDSYYINI